MVSFDAITHSWMVEFIKHRIADKRIVRLIQKWLAAGVMENGQWSESEVGTPQGATISPLMANIYLHYAFDLWANAWRQKHARGEVIILRFADDFIVGFEHRQDAERFLAQLKERFQKFGLELHPDKTRLIEFGRHAAERRRQAGLGKPETFTFLGFRHICARNRRGGFLLRRHTDAKRLRAKLKEVKTELRRRWHESEYEQGAWLQRVLRGYYNYHAVPTNRQALSAFRDQATRHWYQALRRRSQKDRTRWDRMHKLARRWLPYPRIQHPWPEVRFDVRQTQGKSRMQ